MTYLKSLLLKVFVISELVVIILVLLNTIFAIYYEGFHLLSTRKVSLTDILLLFVYLEVLVMIKDYTIKNEICLKYPLYIAIMSIARYIILSIKELSTVDIIWLSLSIGVLVISVIGLVLKERLKVNLNQPNN